MAVGRGHRDAAETSRPKVAPHPADGDLGRDEAPERSGVEQEVDPALPDQGPRREIAIQRVPIDASRSAPVLKMQSASCDHVARSRSEAFWKSSAPVASPTPLMAPALIPAMTSNGIWPGRRSPRVP